MVYAGIKSWFADDKERDFSKITGVQLIHKIFKVTNEYDGGKFFTIENGVKVATPLLFVVGGVLIISVLASILFTIKEIAK